MACGRDPPGHLEPLSDALPGLQPFYARADPWTIYFMTAHWARLSYDFLDVTPWF